MVAVLSMSTLISLNVFLEVAEIPLTTTTTEATTTTTNNTEHTTTTGILKLSKTPGFTVTSVVASSSQQAQSKIFLNFVYILDFSNHFYILAELKRIF